MHGVEGGQLASSVSSSADHQTKVHEIGHGAVPFETSKTMHIFEMTESCGIQQVIAKDPNAGTAITSRL
jgi:hypothetical protein